MYASIFNCSTAFLAWDILVVLFDTSSFILFFLEEKLRQLKNTASRYSNQREDSCLKYNHLLPTTLMLPGCRSQTQTRCHLFLFSCSTAPYCITYFHPPLPVENSIWIMWATHKCRVHSHYFSAEKTLLVQTAHAEPLSTDRPCSHHASLAPYPSYTW